MNKPDVRQVFKMSNICPAKSNIQKFEEMYSSFDENGEQSGQGNLELFLQPVIELVEMVATAGIYMAEQISDLLDQPASKALIKSILT